MTDADVGEREEAPGAFETADPRVQKQYELLSILDSKASALLVFNAMTLTALSVWLNYVSLNIMHLVLDVVYVALLLSCTFLLGIIALRWAKADESIQILESIRGSRTTLYTIAWWLSITSIVVVLITSMIHTVGTALKATDRCGTVCSSFYSENIFGNLDYQK